MQQSKDLGIDPSVIEQWVTFIMTILKVILPLFMGMNPAKMKAKDKARLKQLLGTFDLHRSESAV